MRFMEWAKDGGNKSTVTGFFAIEIKKLFSIVLLRFDNGTREAYHSHAFNAFTWLLKGNMVEHRIVGPNSFFRHVRTTAYKRSLLPKFTRRENIHKVVSEGTSWALTIRGPWADTWQEYIAETNSFVVLTHGRKVVG